MRVLFCLLYMCDNLRELRDNPTETIVPVVSQKKMTLYYIVLLTWIIKSMKILLWLLNMIHFLIFTVVYIYA